MAEKSWQKDDQFVVKASDTFAVCTFVFYEAHFGGLIFLVFPSFLLLFPPSRNILQPVPIPARTVVHILADSGEKEHYST